MQVGVAPVVSADTARARAGTALASLGSSVLPGILVVERSTTLNHLLKRTLAAAGLVARSELASYVETVDHLRRSADLDQHYSLLLIGAPARMTRDFASLLDYLRSGTGAKLPVVLMTHELLAELNEFARSRANLHVMLWSGFNRLPGVVREALHEEDDAAAPAAPTTVPANGIQILLHCLIDTAPIQFLGQFFRHFQNFRGDVIEAHVIKSEQARERMHRAAVAQIAKHRDRKAIKAA